jgi:hypothetical protein
MVAASVVAQRMSICTLRPMIHPDSASACWNAPMRACQTGSFAVSHHWITDGHKKSPARGAGLEFWSQITSIGSVPTHCGPSMTHRGRPGAWPSGLWDELPDFRFRSPLRANEFRLRPFVCAAPFSIARLVSRDGRVSEGRRRRIANRGEPQEFLSTRVYLAVNGTRNNALTDPVVDPICCGGKMGHGRSPDISPAPTPRRVINPHTLC